MKIDEIKDMLPQKPERMESVEEPKKSELVKASYDVIGCILEVYKQLGAGLPEYIASCTRAAARSLRGMAFRSDLAAYPTGQWALLLPIVSVTKPSSSLLRP